VQEQRPAAGEQAARPQAQHEQGPHPDGQPAAHDRQRRDPAEQRDH
jgi:hypothetical protein